MACARRPVIERTTVASSAPPPLPSIPPPPLPPSPPPASSIFGPSSAYSAIASAQALPHPIPLPALPPPAQLYPMMQYVPYHLSMMASPYTATSYSHAFVAPPYGAAVPVPAFPYAPPPALAPLSSAPKPALPKWLAAELTKKKSEKLLSSLAVDLSLNNSAPSAPRTALPTYAVRPPPNLHYSG